MYSLNSRRVTGLQNEAMSTDGIPQALYRTKRLPPRHSRIKLTMLVCNRVDTKESPYGNDLGTTEM